MGSRGSKGFKRFRRVQEVSGGFRRFQEVQSRSLPAFWVRRIRTIVMGGVNVSPSAGDIWILRTTSMPWTMRPKAGAAIVEAGIDIHEKVYRRDRCARRIDLDFDLPPVSISTRTAAGGPSASAKRTTNTNATVPIKNPDPPELS
jgi:hypothetical protein